MVASLTINKNKETKIMAKRSRAPAIRDVWEDLDSYLKFCRTFGYRYDEADLYNWKSYAWQQYNKHINGKRCKDMWFLDTSR